MKKKYIITTVVTAVFLLGVSLLAWLKPADEFSLSERRKLTQFPELSFNTIISGSFMESFEKYTLDQFPLRDKLRTIKAVVALNLFGESENNDIYIYEGYASKMEYPLDELSVERAGERFEYVYNKYLKSTETKNYLAVIPDKNFFLAENSGMLSLDYEKMFSIIKENTSFLTYIDITGDLKKEDFYKNDTHWKQENLVALAEKIGESMGAEIDAEYTEKTLNKEFYGVYYGQSALPLESETIKYLTNDVLDNCIVTYYDTGKPVTGDMYNMVKANGKDPYEMFLSGTSSLLTIENPNADTNKELVIFRDSYAGSIAPLLAPAYSKITLVDIRYIQSGFVGNFVDFNNQDVLFLYSTTLINNSTAMR